MPSPTSPTGDQRYLAPNDRNQYSQTWSFGIQRAITSSMMLEVDYVGTSGNRLLMTTNINAAPPGPTDPTARRPFGSALGEVDEYTNSAHSIYHGLQTKVERRFSKGLYFLGSYTWSKSIDNQSNGTDNSAASGQYPQNPNNWAQDRGPSSFDRTHRFTGSAVWQIPFRPRPERRVQHDGDGPRDSRRMASQRSRHRANGVAVQRSDGVRGHQCGRQQLQAQPYRERGIARRPTFDQPLV